MYELMQKDEWECRKQFRLALRRLALCDMTGYSTSCFTTGLLYFYICGACPLTKAPKYTSTPIMTRARRERWA